MFLSDPQWSLLQPILTPASSRGRPASDPRPILEAVLWKLTTRQPWYDIPSASPSWQTCYQHYHRWRTTGVWQCIINTLIADLHTRGNLDLSLALDNHEFSARVAPSGQLDITYPPHLEDTWQLSTALLIIMLLYSEL